MPKAYFVKGEWWGPKEVLAARAVLIEARKNMLDADQFREAIVYADLIELLEAVVDGMKAEP